MWRNIHIDWKHIGLSISSLSSSGPGYLRIRRKSEFKRQDPQIILIKIWFSTPTINHPHHVSDKIQHCIAFQYLKYFNIHSLLSLVTNIQVVARGLLGLQQGIHKNSGILDLKNNNISWYPWIPKSIWYWYWITIQETWIYSGDNGCKLFQQSFSFPPLGNGGRGTKPAREMDPCHVNLVSRKKNAMYKGCCL